MLSGHWALLTQEQASHMFLMGAQHAAKIVADRKFTHHQAQHQAPHAFAGLRADVCAELHQGVEEAFEFGELSGAASRRQVLPGRTTYRRRGCAPTDRAGR